MVAAWEERLQEAAYTSPSGERLTFFYENVSETFTKKTSGFNFPDADGTFVQDLGTTSRQYPLRVIFWGNNYDLESNLFTALLRERGIGLLEHPMYGTKDVVPFGAISRRDDLKTQANQAIIEVTFWETIRDIFPASQVSPADDVAAALAAYKTAEGEAYEEQLDITTVTNQVVAEDINLSLLDRVKLGLQGIANTVTAVQNQFNAIFDSIESSIDILIDTPLTLAQQTIDLIQSPARAATSITARLDAYKNLSDSIMFNASNVFVIYNPEDRDSNNTFHTNDLYLTASISAEVTSVINNQFETSTGAIAAADLILDQFETMTAWRDQNFASLSQIDTSATYQNLQDAVSLAVGFLIQISFSLKQEHIIILDRGRTIIDLEVELYGTLDENLDFLIRSNNFSGSQILELPAGTSVVYYV